MMDAARAAEQSDPDRNGSFARRWTEPPWHRKGPGVATRADFEKLNHNSASDPTAAELAAQRAMRHALHRIAELGRRARLLDSLGLRDASLRLEALATAIRAEVLA